MSPLRMSLCLAVAAGTASADPAPPPSPRPADPPPVAGPAATAPAPLPLVSSALQLVGIPPTPIAPSLRLEAAKVAADRFANDWRYPEPGPLLGLDSGTWFIGAGYYSPRTTRSAALHGGSIAATLLGEILMAANSPLAGVGALVTGATLDAAAADADRDAEARR